MEREEISRFLKADGGRLRHPTAVAILIDNGLQFQEDFSQDGNAIRTALDHYKIPLRSIGRDADRGGAAERFQIISPLNSYRYVAFCCNDGKLQTRYIWCNIGEVSRNLKSQADSMCHFVNFLVNFTNHQRLVVTYNL